LSSAVVVVVVDVEVVVEVVDVDVDVVDVVEEGEVGALEALKRGFSVEVRAEQTKEFCE
jgi:hypothetical protein